LVSSAKALSAKILVVECECVGIEEEVVGGGGGICFCVADKAFTVMSEGWDGDVVFEDILLTLLPIMLLRV
jgi:hypothetical protein